MAALTTQNLILVGVFAHLLLSLSKLVFKAPKQQAKINAIDSKVDSTVATVQQILPVVQTINRKTLTTVGGAIAAGEGLTQALNPLPASSAVPSQSAVGGAS